MLGMSSRCVHIIVHVGENPPKHSQKPEFIILLSAKFLKCYECRVDVYTIKDLAKEIKEFNGFCFYYNCLLFN